KRDGYLYGLDIGGLKHVLEQDQNCILNVIYDRAIRHLKSVNIHPIVILIKPYSPAQIIEWNDDAMSEENAQKEFKKYQRDEKMFGDLVTHVISDANSFDDIFQQVLDIVNGRQGTNYQPVMKECALLMEPEDEEFIFRDLL
ncbi:hypothetical protein PFISCL1PPCAC_26088, partial [Pristionchus fissidentatus]